MRRRTGVPIMVLCMLVVAGCSDQGPLGGAEKRIDELFAKGPDVMTSLTMTNDSLTVDIVRNEQRLVWELYPEPDAALTPTIEAQSESVYDKVPVMSTSEFPVQATLERARSVAKECVEEYDSYEVKAVAVSRRTVLTMVDCRSAGSSAYLNDKEMPVLATDFSVASLQTLWEELEVIAPTGLFESMYFDNGLLSASVSSFGEDDPTCLRTWWRDLADPANSWATCFEPDDKLGWIDFERLTPERLSEFVDAAEAELTVTGERSEHIISIFQDEQGNTVLRLVHDDDVVIHPL